MGSEHRLTAKQFQDSGDVPDWRVLAFGASAWFDAPSQAAGAEFVRRIGDLASVGARMPDVDVRARGVHVRIVPPNYGGLTAGDLDLARAISAVARDLRLRADPAAVQTVQLTMDALDIPAVMPFWEAALGYAHWRDEDLDDALRRDPGIWFQQQDAPRPLRNRIHLDVSREYAEPLAAQALEAVHGTVMRDAGGYRTLADAEGNEVDVIPAGPSAELGSDPQTADWRAMFGGMTFYPLTDPTRAAALAVAVAALADAAGIALLIDIRPDGVTIDSGKDQWEVEGFVDLARRVQEAARGMGLIADTSQLRFVQIGIDALDIPRVREFWRAVLGYADDPRSDRGVTDIFDPRRLNMPIFFQPMDPTETDRHRQRNRIHVDVFVPHDQAQSRVDAALAAGGRIAYDAEAPEWWTLADPEGNEVDIAVSVGREEIWQAQALAQAQA